MRRDQDDTSSLAILDNDKVTIYHLNHKDKTYIEFSTGSNELQDTALKMVGELKVKITPTMRRRKSGTGTARNISRK